MKLGRLRSVPKGDRRDMVWLMRRGLSFTDARLTIEHQKAVLTAIADEGLASLDEDEE